MNNSKLFSDLWLRLFLTLALLTFSIATPVLCDLLDKTNADSTPASGDGNISQNDQVTLDEAITTVRTSSGETFEYNYKVWRVKEPEVENTGTFSQSRIDLLKIISELEIIYKELLNRKPDPAGLDFWVEKIITGEKTIETVREAIKDSDEYKQNNSSTSQ